jgi:hypothetical protein
VLHPSLPVGLWSSGVRFSEARVYMETPEYRKLKAMIQSLKLNS